MADKFVILADATCDLSEQLRKFFEVNDFIGGYISMSNGKEFSATLDWCKIDREEYYKTLSDKKIKVTTAPISPEEMYEKFKAYVSDGIAVLVMTMSSKISSTYEHACIGAKKVKSEYPDCKIYTFDSLRMSTTFGLLVMYAHLLKKEGKSFDEVVSWLEENKCRVHMMGPIDDLMFIARRGRISMGKAIMGSFAGVKPMGDCNDVGYCTVLAKVKGINKSLEATVKYVEKMARDVENQYIIVSHSNRQEYAQRLKSMLEGKITCKKIFVSDVFPISGANIGPGMICVAFLGDEVSADNVSEKQCLSAIIDNLK